MRQEWILEWIHEDVFISFYIACTVNICKTRPICLPSGNNLLLIYTFKDCNKIISNHQAMRRGLGYDKNAGIPAFHTINENNWYVANLALVLKFWGPSAYTPLIAQWWFLNTLLQSFAQHSRVVTQLKRMGWFTSLRSVTNVGHWPWNTKCCKPCRDWVYFPGNHRSLTGIFGGVRVFFIRSDSQPLVFIVNRKSPDCLRLGRLLAHTSYRS